MSRRYQHKVEKEHEFDPRTIGCKCDECPLGGRNKEIHCAKPPIPRENNLLVVEDFPFKQEIFVGRRVENSNRKFVEHCFRGSGIRQTENNWALLCRPETSDPKVIKSAIECCRPHLKNEKVTHVLGAGAIAFASLTPFDSVTAWLGTPIVAREGLFSAPATVIPTHTPWMVRTKAGSHLAGQFLGHVDRVSRLSDGRLKEFKWPEIITEPTDNDLMVRMQRIEKDPKYGIDLETRSNREISCIGIALENRVVCIQYPFTKIQRFFIQLVLNTGRLITQNGPHFDHRILREHGFTLSERWDDTLLAAAILDPQLAKNLGALVSNEFHAPAHKAEFRLDEETGRIMGDWDSRDPEVERKRRIYCAKDAWTTLMLWNVQEERLTRYA